jgi:lipoic acid synthetase
MLPTWIRPKFPKRAALERMRPALRRWGVNTVCESARCPNLGECFSAGTATFMLLGEVCTRGCRYCAVASGRPCPPDPDEPMRVAQAAREMGLSHLVVTSVTRDDLGDGGASQFVALIRAVRQTCPQTTIEVLVPDFGGDREAVAAVCAAGPDVFGHNLETVARLFATVRPGADYDRSLEVLRWAKADFGCAITKSGLMVGLGESDDEVLQAARDLRGVGVDSLTVGQYLQPTREHLPVAEHVPPERFGAYATAARAMGFVQVLSGPLVRSSYHAAMPAGTFCGDGDPAA